MQLYLAFKTLLIISFSVNEAWSQLSCMDENNKMVDWFIALKYPKSFDFVYLTPNNDQWQPSLQNLSSAENMVALTLRQSYNKNFFYAYYNDESPIPVNFRKSYSYSERGHLKGVVNFDKSSGYWLVHSVPKFPFPVSYNYSHSERIYAQSFICVTVGITNLFPIVEQLLMMESSVYSHNIPADFSNNNTLMSAINTFVKNKPSNKPKSIRFDFKTLRQLQIVHFGKSNQFDQDLYASLIAPSIKASLYVETWIRGEKINSSCSSSYKVFNVKKVKLPKGTYIETKDHSKWAVSTSVDQPYVCIGDINRMTSQFKRGGGSICVSNKIIWANFAAVVALFEEC